MVVGTEVVALGEGVMVVAGWVVVEMEVEALVEVVMAAECPLPPVVLEVIEVMVASRVVMGWLVELVEARALVLVEAAALVMEVAEVVVGWVAVVASEEEELVVKVVVVAAEVVMAVVGLVVVMVVVVEVAVVMVVVGATAVVGAGGVKVVWVGMVALAAGFHCSWLDCSQRHQTGRCSGSRQKGTGRGGPAVCPAAPPGSRRALPGSSPGG